MRLCKFATFLAIPLVFNSNASYGLFVCTNYHCKNKQFVTINNQQIKSLRDIFKQNKSSKEEQENIRIAIAQLETVTGLVTGTSADLAKNFAGTGKKGQLDCISESINTTSYLRLLENYNILKFYSVEPRKIRRRFFVAEHWTAVIKNKSNNNRFAVDSWFLKNGEKPYIQNLNDWLSHKKFTKENPDK